MHKTRFAAAGGLLIASGLLVGSAAPAAAVPADEAPDCTEDKCVALTFDDGPGEYTDELLDMLDEHDAKATFYVLGSKVDGFTDEVARMAGDGHDVGNHTWDHDDLTTLSAEEIKKDLDRTDEAVNDVIGEDPVTMRPPYGALNDTALNAVDHPVLLWDVDTLDWQSLDSDKILDVTMDETTDGSVVLFHDIHETSVNAIPDVLEELEDEDYEFVTVSDLFDDGLEPGTAYTDARSH